MLIFNNVSILLLFIYLTSCTIIDEKEESNLNQKLKEEKLEAFASKFNAIVGWKDSLNRKHNVYTFQIQDFFSKHNQPILIQAYLDDIVLSDGTYYLELDDFFSLDPECHYKLRCDYSIIEKIISDSASFFYSPIIIAQINSVTRGFKFNFEPESFDEYDIVGSIENEKIVILEGLCLDTIGDLQ